MMYCFWNAASYVMMAQEENNGLTDQLDLAKKQQKGRYKSLNSFGIWIEFYCSQDKI